MDRQEILAHLREESPDRLACLYAQADAARRENVGDQVHLRGLLEISNHCRRRCGYCGISACRSDIPRYRMSLEEIVEGAGRAVNLGYGTVVLQAGEDLALTTQFVSRAIRTIKDRTSLAVTLSLGEREPAELDQWRRDGADRYLLRIETSDRSLFEAIHPALPGRSCDRIGLLRALRAMGYEVGSGVLVGIPGQSYDSLADDIALLGELDLDMIGCGPFIPHPDTPLGRGQGPAPLPRGQQVPADETMGYKVLALTRLVCPRANIPVTTALATLNQAGGRECGLMRGGNVVMPNLTPPKYRRLYEIYPAKACLSESVNDFHRQLALRIDSIGRRIGRGRGDSPRFAGHRPLDAE